MRSFFLILHRYVGLLMAAFLFVTGLTGAIISWDHELDRWLNPHLLEARGSGRPHDALDLAAQIEMRHPQVQVVALPLAAEAGDAYAFWVMPQIDPVSRKLFTPGFNQIFVDPLSGEELGRREWGAVWPINAENVVSFLYKLHFSLHIPSFFGSERWGIWLLGSIALLWIVDCFTGFVLTLPARRKFPSKPGKAAGRSFWQRWAPSWKVRWQGGSYKINFDFHRAASLWTWALLFILAFTAFSLNLYREVFFPAMSLVSTVTASPFDVRTATAPDQPITPRFGFAEALAVASREAGRRGWPEAAGSIFYDRHFGIYGIDFFAPEDAHGVAGVGHKRLYVDGLDGRYLGERLPWQGTTADIFVQAQFPLHSGRILGLPGRILISLMGLVVALLSVSGVYIWWRKRRGRWQMANRRSCKATATTE